MIFNFTFVFPVASGEKVGAYSLTEPMSGSDAATMRSTAVRDGDEYIINGRKSWVTGGPVADYVIVYVVTDPDKGVKGITSFITDADQAGFVRGKKEPKMGIRASATSEIVVAA